jgi:hypothetical protein
MRWKIRHNKPRERIPKPRPPHARNDFFAERPNSRPAIITPRKDWTPNQEAIFQKIQADIAARRKDRTT